MDIANPEAGIKENIPHQVNSDNLINFLIGITGKGQIFPDIDRDNFPSELNLFWATNYISEMYEAKKVGEYLPEKRKEELKKSAEEIKSVDQSLANPFQELAKESGVLEESRSVFFDFKSRSIEATEIIFGSGFDVKTKQLDAFKKGFLLLELHTHPESILPSANDYLVMMFSLGGGRRIANGTIILCPEGQILVLPTKDTPKFENWKDGFELIEKINAERGEEIKDGTKEFEIFKDVVLRKYEETVKDEVFLLAKARKEGDESAVTEALNRIKEMMATSLNQIKPGIGPADNQEAIIINQQGLSIANRFGVCLYWSTDGENFTKFSA